MSQTSRKAKHLPSASTLTTDARQPSSFVKVNPSTLPALPLPQSAQSAGSIPTSIPLTNPLLTPTLSAVNRSKNDPELLTGVLRATVQMMHQLGMLTVGKTPAGRLVIVLTPDMFNDDLTLKAAV